MRRSPATAPGRRRRLIRIGCPRNCRGAGEGPAAVVWDECAPCTARHSERNGADCGKSLRGGGLSAQDVPGTVGEREKVRQRLFGTNVRPAQRGIPKGAAPTAGNPSAADAFPHGMSPDLPQGAGERPAAVVRGECAPCAARHSERNGADCGKSLRGGRLFARDVPGTCRRAGEGPAAVVRDECAPCAARHSERSGADCGKSLRDGGLSARDVPGPCRRERENVRQRRTQAGAKKRQAPEKLMKT